MPEKVWQKIKLHAGETFYTKTGLSFSYHIRNDYIILENTNHTIPRKHIEEALLIQSDTVTAYSKFRGPSYLYSIMHDPRIV